MFYKLATNFAALCRRPRGHGLAGSPWWASSGSHKASINVDVANPQMVLCVCRCPGELDRRGVVVSPRSYSRNERCGQRQVGTEAACRGTLGIVSDKEAAPLV